MTLFDLFDLFEQSAVGEAIRNSLWAFPVIEAGHLLALALLGGSVLVVDLRLVGLGLKDHPVQRIADGARPWLMLSLVGLFATGIPLFLSEAIKCYFSPAFWLKMGSLAVAVAFTFTLRRWTVHQGERGSGPLSPAPVQGIVGLVSMALWFTVAASGRWIGFS